MSVLRFQHSESLAGASESFIIPIQVTVTPVICPVGQYAGTLNVTLGPRLSFELNSCAVDCLAQRAHAVQPTVNQAQAESGSEQGLMMSWPLGQAASLIKKVTVKMS